MSVKQDLIAGEMREAQLKLSMGAEKYEAWVRSMQIYKYTNFKDYEELKMFLKKAGFTIKRITTEKYLYIKTRIADNDGCIYWITREGKIVGVVSTMLEADFLKFINKMENVVGHECFFDDVKGANALPENTFPTTFTDKDILKKALNNFDFYLTTTSNGFKFTYNDCTIYIKNSKNNNYDLKIVGYADMEKMYQLYKDIENEYALANQKQICDDIKQRVEESNNMQLESEMVMEDDSVLLTIII